MKDDAKSFLSLVGGLLTHAWVEGYEFSEEEKKEIDKAITILFQLMGEMKNA